MTELNLTPMDNNGSYYFSTIVISGNIYNDASIYFELENIGKIWFEISYDGVNWFLLKGTTFDGTSNSIIPVSNFNKSLLYRVCSSEKVNTLKLITQ